MSESRMRADTCDVLMGQAEDSFGQEGEQLRVNIRIKGLHVTRA